MDIQKGGTNTSMADLEQKQLLLEKFKREIADANKNVSTLRQHRSELLAAAQQCSEAILKLEVVRNNRNLALQAMKQHMQLKHATAEQLDEAIDAIKQQIVGCTSEEERNKLEEEVKLMAAQRPSVQIFQNQADRILFDLETDRRDSLSLRAERDAKVKAAQDLFNSEDMQIQQKVLLREHEQRLTAEIDELMAKLGIIRVDGGEEVDYGGGEEAGGGGGGGGSNDHYPPYSSHSSHAHSYSHSLSQQHSHPHSHTHSLSSHHRQATEDNDEEEENELLKLSSQPNSAASASSSSSSSSSSLHRKNLSSNTSIGSPSANIMSGGGGGGGGGGGEGDGGWRVQHSHRRSRGGSFGLGSGGGGGVPIGLGSGGRGGRDVRDNRDKGSRQARPMYQG